MYFILIILAALQLRKKELVLSVGVFLASIGGLIYWHRYDYFYFFTGYTRHNFFYYGNVLYLPDILLIPYSEAWILTASMSLILIMLYTVNVYVTKKYF